MEHDGVSQLPVSRQLIVALTASYPASQVTAAVDPNVVLVNAIVPLSTVIDDPQSANVTN